MNLTIALERSVAGNERMEFYDRYATRTSLFASLYSHVELYFPKDFLSLVMLNISNEPIPMSYSEQMTESVDKQSAERALVIINSRIYFKEAIKSEDLNVAFRNYTPMITLVTNEGQGNSIATTFAEQYSDFESNHSAEFSSVGNSFVICFNSSCNDSATTSGSPKPDESSTPVPQHTTTRSLFQADIELHTDFNTTSDNAPNDYQFANMTALIYEQVSPYFPNTLVKTVVSNITSGAPSAISRRRKREQHQPLRITVHASVYFALYYTAAEIANVFQDAQLLIYAPSNNGDSTVWAGNVSLTSIFSDTYIARDTTDVDNAVLNCIHVQWRSVQ